MLSGILRFVAPLYEIASGHKYRAGSYRSASNSTRDTRSECEIARTKRLDEIRRDTTRYDAIRFDTMRPGTKEGFQCRRSSFEGTRNFLHSKHSCEKFRARKSWQILRVAFYPPPLCSLSIQFVLYFHPLFLPLCRPFSRCFRAMQTSVFVTRRKTTLGNVFTFRRAYSEPVQRRVLNELSDPLPRGASISTSSHRGFRRDENFPFRSVFRNTDKIKIADDVDKISIHERTFVQCLYKRSRVKAIRFIGRSNSEITRPFPSGYMLISYLLVYVDRLEDRDSLLRKNVRCTFFL